MTNTQRLREIAKFAAGLVAGDLLFGLSLILAGSLPQPVFGLWITGQIAWLWIGFDAVLLFGLFHYAWKRK